mgnify:CR=1 FL=1
MKLDKVRFLEIFSEQIFSHVKKLLPSSLVTSRHNYRLWPPRSPVLYHRGYFFTPIFFYTKIFTFFTLIFYTKIFVFLHQNFCFFYTIFFQFLLESVVTVCYPKTIITNHRSSRTPNAILDTQTLKCFSFFYYQIFVFLTPNFQNLGKDFLEKIGVKKQKLV